jgi:hypothetical protein
MKTTQDTKCPDKTENTGTIRMGREVKNKDGSCCDSDAATKAADKKTEAREDRASSKVWRTIDNHWSFGWPAFGCPGEHHQQPRYGEHIIFCFQPA